MTLRAIEDELTGAVDRLRASVVRIRPRRSVATSRGSVEVEGAGTGLVIDRRGYLLTNDHVVRGANEIEATLDDGRAREGEIVGEDPATDLAVIRVNIHDLPAAELADSETLRVGQFAIALGNSLGLPGGPSASVGVISALGRPLPGADHILEGLIQTDAAINPGNSGGPLAQLDGKVIGVNTAMIPSAQRIGFAIPSNTVRYVVDQILDTGRVSRPWLGISGLGVNAAMARRFALRSSEGVLVADFDESGPAAAAGLRRGDVIVRVGPFAVQRLRDLLSALAHLPLGGAVDIEYTRAGRSRRGVLRIVEAPIGVAAA